MIGSFEKKGTIRYVPVHIRGTLDYCPVVVAQTCIPKVPILYDDYKRMLFPILSGHFLVKSSIEEEGVCFVVAALWLFGHTKKSPPLLE